MRYALSFLIAGVVFVPARAADEPPKIDLKKGVALVGRSEARAVQLRSRVSGFLARVHVKEGEAVKKGTLLAEVDDRAFKAELGLARAKTVKAEATLKLRAAELARAKDAHDKGAGTKEELTRAEGAHDEAKAELDAAKAALVLAELNLSYTKLTAPIDGRMGFFLVTEGTLIKADETGIVHVIALDPMTVAFDADERTFLAVRRAIGEKGKAVVEVGFGDGDGYSHTGTLDALPVEVDPKTGKVLFRATLANPKGEIVNGLFLRVRLRVEPK